MGAREHGGDSRSDQLPWLARRTVLVLAVAAVATSALAGAIVGLGHADDQHTSELLSRLFHDDSADSRWLVVGGYTLAGAVFGFLLVIFPLATYSFFRARHALYLASRRSRIRMSREMEAVVRQARDRAMP